MVFIVNFYQVKKCIIEMSIFVKLLLDFFIKDDTIILYGGKNHEGFK